MIVKEKRVYYCGFCKKHGLSRHAMEGHESKCTMNPGRTCSWKMAGEEHVTVDLPATIVRLRERSGESPYQLNAGDIDWLRDELNGCPACMLAALRQSGLEYHYTQQGNLWDYAAELDRFREAEREAYRGAEYGEAEREAYRGAEYGAGW